MEKITILSPVHISTGRDIESPSYFKNTNQSILRYDFVDVLSQFPQDLLINKEFLDSIALDASNQVKGKRLYKYIKKYVDYSKIKSKYILKCTLSNNIDYNISEQVKDLGKPYIPGSSVKGALLNAWFYYIFEKENELIKKRIDKVLKQFIDMRKISLLDLLCDNQLNGYKHDDFLKDVQSCIRCRDLYFSNMELFEAKRIGTGKEMKGVMPLTYKECISQGQTIKEMFFDIDKKRLKKLKERYKNNKFFVKILEYLNESIFLDACNFYTKDMLHEEFSNQNQMLYSDYYPINNQLLELNRMLRQDFESSTNNLILRLGNSTNYNFKTISLFIKKHYPDQYNKYFKQLFSPSLKTSRKSMPKTRVVLKNSDGYILPGFIRVSYDKKS